MLSFKFLMINLADMLFPLLQPPGPGPGEKQAPITEGIILLLASAFGLGYRYFTKKDKK